MPTPAQVAICASPSQEQTLMLNRSAILVTLEEPYYKLADIYSPDIVRPCE